MLEFLKSLFGAFLKARAEAPVMSNTPPAPIAPIPAPVVKAPVDDGVLNIVVTRKWFNDEATIGEMTVNGKFECYTLEDEVRKGIKVDGETAIPTGKYKVVVDMSTRFGKLMPHVFQLDGSDPVGFAGIRIHSGNTDKDTLGCLLVGKTREGTDLIGGSHDAFNALFPKIQAAKAVYLTITGDRPNLA